MAKRHFADWIQTFTDYAYAAGEAPKRMYFWAGVSAIAGALRRKVWIDMRTFKLFPNFYIVFVAPPGIVAKSTTADVAMRLLRKVPGIRFGPSVVTWQSLVQSLAQSAETFVYNGEHHTMSAITLEASEFGNLLNPQDREMVDVYVRLWDGSDTPFEKQTKLSGNDTIHMPWINMIACTTPSWIAGTFPEYIIGGGFTSRCVFVYAEAKDKLVAYPDELVIPGYAETTKKLIEDLETISLDFSGPMEITERAREFGRAWYDRHFRHAYGEVSNERLRGNLARKQAMIHKLAMILSVATRDDYKIDLEEIVLAENMVTDLEQDAAKVFSKIGQSEVASVMDRLLLFIRSRPNGVAFGVAFQFVHSHIPSLREFEDLVNGCIRAGYIAMVQVGNQVMLRAVAAGEPVVQQVPSDQSAGTEQGNKDKPEDGVLAA